MLGDVSLLFHQLTDAVGRGRTEATAVHVTGLASPGKARLLAALSRALEPIGIAVRTGPAPPSTSIATLCVHAETDLEAWVEGSAANLTRDDESHADLVLRVDWEPIDRSVQRVVTALVERGFPIAGTGV